MFVEELNKRIRKVVFENKIPNPINMTLTERQQFNGINIDDVVSEQNVRHFRNVLNRKVFGNRHRRFGTELKMLVIREVSSHQRHHLHLIVEQPNRLTYPEFKNLVKDCWLKTDFGHFQTHFEKPCSEEREDGWVSYLLKNRTKVSLESSIDWSNSTIFH